VWYSGVHCLPAACKGDDVSLHPASESECILSQEFSLKSVHVIERKISGEVELKNTILKISAKRETEQEEK
jgi:hypothetical protein